MPHKSLTGRRPTGLYTKVYNSSNIGRLHGQLVGKLADSERVTSLKQAKPAYVASYNDAKIKTISLKNKYFTFLK